MSTTLDPDAEILALFRRLSPEQKQRVLGFAEGMLADRKPKGTPPSAIAHLRGTLSREAAEEMKRIIAEGEAVPSWPKRAKARDLRAMVGSISRDDLDVMTRTIETECERIDPHGW